MSFAAGPHIFAIPGPTPVPEAVLNAMHHAGADIYAGPVVDADLRLRERLNMLAGTRHNLATYIGNGHAAWEAAIRNMLAPGDKALVVTSGGFGAGWMEHARGLGVEAEELFQPRDAAPDPDALADRLARDRNHEIRAVLIAQVDTATGVRADIPAMRRAMGEHPALFAVDAIASAGCEPLDMDASGIDVLVAASQKGLMTPPGLSVVWFSDRADARTKDAGPYWNWHMRAHEAELWRHWGGTPPVHLIWGLDAALGIMLDQEGLPAVYARHDGLAQAVWAAFDAWGQGNPAIRCRVADPVGRARSVTAAYVPGANALRAWCETKAGVTLGVGIGLDDPDTGLRVAHMGAASAHMILGTLAVMEAGFCALDIPHGSGAVEAAAAVLARLA